MLSCHSLHPSCHPAAQPKVKHGEVAKGAQTLSWNGTMQKRVQEGVTAAEDVMVIDVTITSYSGTGRVQSSISHVWRQKQGAPMSQYWDNRRISLNCTRSQLQRCRQVEVVEREISCEPVQTTKAMIPSELMLDRDNCLTHNALCGSLWFRLPARPHGLKSRVKHSQHC